MEFEDWLTKSTANEIYLNMVSFSALPMNLDKLFVWNYNEKLGGVPHPTLPHVNCSSKHEDQNAITVRAD